MFAFLLILLEGARNPQKLLDHLLDIGSSKIVNDFPKFFIE